MALTAFTSRLGRSQGRIRGTAGDWSFVLGELEEGQFCELAPGDHVEISQELDLTDQDLFRADLCLRVPEELLASLAWEAQLRVDGITRASARSKPGRARHITDLAANLSKLTGVHTLAIRLELVEV